MKKIVYESLKEFNHANQINEGFFDDAKSKLSSIKDKFLSSFKKVGNFFVALFNGNPVKGVSPPINIGIMLKYNMINSGAISYFPSPEDLELDPTLQTPSKMDIINKRSDLTGEDSDPLRRAIELAMTEVPGPLKGNVSEARVPLKHPGNVPTVNTAGLKLAIEGAYRLKNDSRLLIWGAPGIGKTAIINSILLGRPGTRLIDVATGLMNYDDWQLPSVRNVRVDWSQAFDIPKDWLPVYKPTGDPEEDALRNNIANGGDEKTEGKGGIIFFDEISRADPKVQSSCLKIIDERKVGQYLIGNKWVILAAANRRMDDPESGISMSTALMNRFSHINFEPTVEEWIEWAYNKVDKRIIDYLRFYPDDFFTLDDEDTTGEAAVFASPRSWKLASDNLAILMELQREGLAPKTIAQIKLEIAKAIGTSGAERIGAFIKLLEEYRPEEIKMIYTDPDKVKLPKAAGTGYSIPDAHALLSAAVLHKINTTITPEEFTNFAKFLIRLDNSSLATAAMKNTFKYHDYINEELGEIPGKDKYAEGFNLYSQKYKDSF